MEFLKILFRRKVLVVQQNSDLSDYYDLALSLNASLSAQNEQLKKQVNDQAQRIRFLSERLGEWDRNAAWVYQLTEERGEALGITPELHAGEAARVALAAVWQELDLVRQEREHCSACCAELRAKLDKVGTIRNYAAQIKDAFQVGDTDDILQAAGRLADYFIESRGDFK